MEPQNRIGLANLTKMAFDGIDLNPLRSQLLSQCLEGENTQGALMDLSVIDQLHGNSVMGLEWQAKALEGRRVFRTNRQRAGKKTLLVFAETGAMGVNTPVEFLLQGSDFEIITYFPRLDGEEKDTLPDHDVAFCSAPVDSKTAQPFVEKVRDLTRGSKADVINLPGSAITFERDALEQCFPNVDGLRFPRTTRIGRELEDAVQDQIIRDVGDFPLVIRPVGTHAGVGLAKLNSFGDLEDYLSERLEQEFFISEFVDYASSKDGAFRKYRIVFVDGVAFPCHMAISEQWDVWYMNSNMQDSAEKRREEAEFMAVFERDFALQHRRAFEALTDGVDLDYFGIDCAEDADGNLVVFEADNALIVHDMDPETIFPYKQNHMRRIFAAFESMLSRRCRSVVESEARPVEALKEECLSSLIA